MDQPRTQETNHSAAKDSFGVHLRREREMRGVTLEEISSATRIGTRFLEALESEHFERLPGGVFNRGFVRSTSQFLGLDPEAMLAEYTLATADSTRAVTAPTLIHSQSSWTPRAGSAQRENGWLPWVVLIVIIALGAGGWLGWRHYRAVRRAREAAAALALTPAATDAAQPASAPNPPAMAATPDAPTPSAQPEADSPAADTATAATSDSSADRVNGTAADPESAADSGAPSAAASTTPPASAPAPAPAPIASSSAPLVLKIEAGRVTSVKVSIDGKKAFQGKIPAGGAKIFHANDVFYVTAHDAGGLLLELNGQTLPPLGPPGHSGSIRLSRETLKSQDGTNH